MSNKTVLNIKISKSLKEEARDVADIMGLPLSTVVNNFLRSFVRDRKVEFSAPYKMSAKLEGVLQKVESDTEKGKNVSKSFATEKGLQKHLDSLKG